MYTRLKLIAVGALWFLSLLYAILYWHPWHWLVWGALTFSWIGDAMLARFHPIARFSRDPFIMGMAFFAVAQVFYILAAANCVYNIEKLHMRLPGYVAGYEVLSGVLPVYLLLGILIWALLVARSVKPTMLKVFSLIYSELVCVMAAYTFAASFTGSFFVWQLMVGGFLFIVSDSAIAANLFRDRFVSEKFFEAVVWGTYFPAQLLLLLGFIRMY